MNCTSRVLIQILRSSHTPVIIPLFCSLEYPQNMTIERLAIYMLLNLVAKMKFRTPFYIIK